MIKYILIFSLALAANAYYVPGTYPQEFKYGDTLEVYVNSLTSFETDLPFEYYTMPFCKPQEGVKKISNTANPGTILEGQRIENSPYKFDMKIKETGVVACQPKGYYGPLTKSEVKNLKHKIDNGYRVRMVLDNLPITTYDLLDEDQEFVRPGFELGYKENGKYYIYNHLVFNVLVHMTHGEYTEAMNRYKDAAALESMNNRRVLSSTSAGSSARTLAEGGDDDFAADDFAAEVSDEGMFEEDSRWMVVGFEVSPCSIKREPGKEIEDIVCGVDDDAHITAQEIVEGAKIVYTYDVYWQESNIKWASRWDAYLRMPGGKQVHWFSICNSILVVFVMATVVGMILVRTVRRDLAKYEQLMVDNNNMDLKEEAGWKLVSGDVFRTPSGSKKLAMQVGTGVQVILVTLVTLLLATLGFLSPAARGALLTTTIVLYVWLALVAGFVAVAAWGIMERSYANWRSVAAWTSVYFPGITMLLFTIVNLAIHSTGSSGAVPVGMYFSMVAVWFLVSIPLTFGGGYMATRTPILDYPVKTNQIPRHVPPPPIGANPWLLFFAAGVLPFGAIFIELYFALTSLWLGFFYYLFGFVFIIGLLMLIINAEISILCTYVQLCAEDYNWWWSSFHRGGSVAMYMALYAIAFLFSGLTTLQGFLPIMIYLSYMAIFVTGFYLAMGTVGLLSSFGFTYAIFKAVKQD